VGITPSTAIAFLTHDPKIDDPGLEIALKSPAFYVGALGSKNTQRGRRSRLGEMGISEDLLEKIKGPIGLDLGGRTPAEIALAIMAEIVHTWNKP
jgi:xanthine dehydrogenase accessory factor